MDVDRGRGRAGARLAALEAARKGPPQVATLDLDGAPDGVRRISRAAVLLHVEPGNQIPTGQQWICWRHDPPAWGRVFPLPNRLDSLRALRRHEREVHRVVRQAIPEGQMRLGEQPLRARGAR